MSGGRSFVTVFGAICNSSEIPNSDIMKLDISIYKMDALTLNYDAFWLYFVKIPRSMQHKSMQWCGELNVILSWVHPHSPQRFFGGQNELSP